MVTQAGAKKAFATASETVSLLGKDVEVKLPSSFNFIEMSEMSKLQEEMEGLAAEAKEEGLVDEEGEPDMNNARFSLRFVELHLKTLHMNVRDGITWEEMMLIPAYEIEDLRYFLEDQEEERTERVAKERDQRKQKRQISAKKTSGKT